MSALLTVDVRHRAGSLSLRAAFSLHTQRTALFGPSGVGKSTLLRILAGLARPDQGLIALDGRLLLDTDSGLHVPPGARGIGFLIQSGALFPHLSVEANLRFGLHSLDAATQRRRIEEVIDLLRLGDLRSRLPARLSGGERQRVALARALAPQHRLLLLDEPFSALDTARKEELWTALPPYLAERKIATLLVSHDAGEVWSGAESVIRMDDGVATEQGRPELMLRREREQVLRQLGQSTR